MNQSTLIPVQKPLLNYVPFVIFCEIPVIKDTSRFFYKMIKKIITRRPYAGEFFCSFIILIYTGRIII